MPDPPPEPKIETLRNEIRSAGRAVVALRLAAGAFLLLAGAALGLLTAFATAFARADYYGANQPPIGWLERLDWLAVPGGLGAGGLLLACAMAEGLLVMRRRDLRKQLARCSPEER